MSFGDAELRQIIDQLLEGCQIIARDWKYLYVNEAVARHGRKTKEDLLGHTMMEVYPGIDQSSMFATLKRVMETGVRETLVNEFTYPDGSRAWFQLSVLGVPQGVVIMSLDITGHKKAEEEIRQLNVDLERRVIERTEDEQGT